MQHAGIQFPNQGSNWNPLQWKWGVLTTGPPGKPYPQILELDNNLKKNLNILGFFVIRKYVKINLRNIVFTLDFP